jgi:RNA polymerase sigma-70 factor (ECF subfamily)
MAAYAAGDRRAFDELFERHRAAIWTFFRRRSADPAAAEELTQDTFVGVLRAASRYRPVGAFRSYLFGVAFRTLGTWRRQRRRLAAAHDEHPDRVAPASDPASVLWVRRALAALDEIDREVLMLREYEQLRYDEIASLLGIPMNTVRSRLFRARMALKAQLNGGASRRGDRT